MPIRKHFAVVGDKFGKWTVTGVDPQSTKCDCVCECGRYANRIIKYLVNGKTNSCWFCRPPVLKHGHALYRNESSIYRTWKGIRGRCLNTSNTSYKDYGGRGITVCAEWMQFANFLRDVGERPSPAHSIDRVDNNGNYEPGNVRWATREQQMSNRRNSINLAAFGESRTIKEWAAIFGIPYSRIFLRIRSGWDAERAIAERSQRKPITV